jgi:hypothetical protein
MKRLRLFLGVLGSGAILLGTGGAAHAQRWDSCSVRVRHDQQQLNEAIDRYGYNSRNAQHERAELQRDAANCGYDNYGDQRYPYNDGDRDDFRYRSSNDYREGYQQALDNGYRDGQAIGERDGRRGKGFRPEKNDWYEDADRGYNRSSATRTSTSANTAKASRAAMQMATDAGVNGSRSHWRG